MNGKPAPRKPRPKAPTRTPSEPYGGWMFARDFSKSIFSLLNTGKAYPAFGLLIVALMGVVAWRLPAEQIAPIIIEFFSLIKGSLGAWIFLLFGSNLTWAWLFKRQKKLLCSEIDRLTEERRELFHGVDVVKIQNHRSSASVEFETHIFRDSNPSSFGENEK